jgi:hypothetical protein
MLLMTWGGTATAAYLTLSAVDAGQTAPRAILSFACGAIVAGLYSFLILIN